METLNEKPCQYCGKNFIAKRNTRKYCTDNCRQMDYFKRNGFTPAKNEDFEEEEIDLELGKNAKILLDSEPELTNEKIEEVVFPESEEDVEEELEQTEGHFRDQLASEENTNEEFSSDSEESNPTQINETSERKTFIVKSEEKNEAKIFPLTQNTEDAVKSDFTVKDNIEKPSLKNVALNYKKGALPVNKKESGVKEENKKAPEYSYRNPQFFDWINKQIDKLWHFKLMEPHKHWSSAAVVKVKWVCPRVRSLLENIIKISRLPFIDRASLLALTDAFVRLCKSENFLSLPLDFPYTGTVIELKDKLVNLVPATKGEEKIRFRLSPKRKAILIAMRYEMASLFPRIKFSDLNFGDEASLYRSGDMESNVDDKKNGHSNKEQRRAS